MPAVNNTQPMSLGDVGQTCDICSGGLNDCDAKQGLMCGHMFHKFCIDSYLEARPEWDVLGDVVCPKCSQSAKDFEGSSCGLDAAQSAGALEISGSQVDSGPPTQREIEVASGASSQPGAASGTSSRDEVASGPSSHQAPPLKAAASFPFIAAKERLEPGLVFCEDCGNKCELVRCRLLSKKRSTWRCCSCSSKCVMLSKIHGTWPSDAFKALPVTAKQEFMKEADNTMRGLKVAYERTLKSYGRDERYFEEQGAYLPLSVWAKKGFNTKNIEERSDPSDIAEDRVLGRVFRVRLMLTGKRAVAGTSQEEQLGASKRFRTLDGFLQRLEALAPAAADGDAPATGAAPSAEAPDKVNAGDSCNSSSSSSDSSSNSSSSTGKKDKKKKGKKKDKKKKGKKAKQDKKKKGKGKKAAAKEKERQRQAKEAEKQQAAAAKQQAKGDRKVVSQAEGVIKKVEPALAALRAEINHPSSMNVPAEIMEKVRNQEQSWTTTLQTLQLTKDDPQANKMPDVGKDPAKRINQIKDTLKAMKASASKL